MMMQCQRCGREIGQSQRCNYCGYLNGEVGRVREMTTAERNNYNGITLEAKFQDDRRNDRSESHARSNFYDRSSFEYQTNPRGAFVDVEERNIWAQLFGNHIITRILVAIVLLMLIAFTIFVALPLALTVVGVAVVYVFIRRFLRLR